MMENFYIVSNLSPTRSVAAVSSLVGAPAMPYSRGGTRRLRRVSITLRQCGAFQLTGACALLSLLCVGLCSHLPVPLDQPGRNVVTTKCIESEKKALLDVRAGIWDASNRWRPSWDEKIVGGDCCLWEGVACDFLSGHVIKLDLRPKNGDDYMLWNDYLLWNDDNYLPRNGLDSKVNPSLLNLTSLRYLDLSGNFFDGAPIPGFISSLVNLQHLNLSHTGFSGLIPPQLGDLRNLHSLDLSSNFDGLQSQSLGWLSHLSKLEYLDMSGVDLSAASDWLQAINQLPSLSLLSLSYCNLNTLPTNLPHAINLTSLTTLVLSGNDFTGPGLPLWLSNITTLSKLDLSGNYAGSDLPWNYAGSELNGLGPLSQLSQLEYLDMSGVDLSSAIDWLHVIDKLPSLSVLCLSRCSIPNIPTSTCSVNFTSLTTLDLSWTLFDTIKWPLWLFNITTLTELDLSGNTFYVTIPDAFQNTKHLEVLMLKKGYGLRGGSQRTLPPSLLALHKLRLLALSDIQLPVRMDKYFSSLQGLELENIIGRIPESLGSLVHLESLTLYYCNITKETFEALGNLMNLRSLSLSVDSIKEIILPESLRNLSHLESFRLHGYYYMSKQAFEGLGSLLNLRILDLSVTEDISIPESLSNLRHLEYLRFTTTGIINELPFSLGKLSRLKALQLSAGNLNVSIPETLGSLNNLQFLGLMGIMKQNIPESLGNLQNLKYLDLRGTFIQLPQSLGNLVNLKSLSLNGVHVSLPKSIGNLTFLQSLFISSDNLTTGMPGFIGHLVSLKDLRLFSNNVIEGSIIGSLGNLSSLKTIAISGFNINQELLSSMGHLCTLTQLEISGNTEQETMVNELLEGLAQCTQGSSLKRLDLRGNRFGGHLPDQVRHLSNLKYLDLSGNFIVGSIPESIGQLQSLSTLRLGDNNFAGALTQVHFANLSKLETLDVSQNSALSLSINESWIPSFQLVHFLARACSIGPEFPMWLKKQESLFELDISANVIDDNINSDFFSSFPSIQILNLSHNAIRGNLPSFLSSLPMAFIDLSFNHFKPLGLQLQFSSNLEHFDVSHNFISGQIVVTIGDSQLRYLGLSHNNINGSIPSSICQISSLQVLDLSYNYLTGSIPNCWNSTNLVAMRFSQNKLQGTIPNSFQTLPHLTSLHLDKNNLSGGIPPSLKHLEELMTLDLSDNQLFGVIPSWLGKHLSSLQVLKLRSNKFYGSVPMSLSQLQFLRVLDLASNRLSGNLLLSFRNFTAMVKFEKSQESSYFPPSVAAAGPTASFTESVRIVPKGTELEYTTILPLVTIIDFSGNRFSGNFPEEITSLRGLLFLIMSGNNLGGEIPRSISGMRMLESLDLSSNQLYGDIPSSISSLHFLSHLNVSFNNLYGRIPTGGQLQTFDQPSYVGNPGLCGPPLLRPCPDDVTSQGPTFQPRNERDGSDETYMAWLHIGMGTGFVVGLWGFLGVLFLMEKKRLMFFCFIDRVADELNVLVIVHSARLRRKIHV